MPSLTLQVNDTPEEVALCEWHLRRIFKKEKFEERVRTGEFTIVRRQITKRTNASGNAPSIADAPFNEEVVIAVAATLQEVARAHRFLEADQATPYKNRALDPKQINWNGRDYHQTGRRNPDCAHCKAGISTYPEAR